MRWARCSALGNSGPFPAEGLAEVFVLAGVVATRLAAALAFGGTVAGCRLVDLLDLDPDAVFNWFVSM